VQICGLNFGRLALVAGKLFDFRTVERNLVREIARALQRQVGVGGAQHQAPNGFRQERIVDETGIDEAAVMFERVVARMIDAAGIAFTVEADVERRHAEMLQEARIVRARAECFKRSSAPRIGGPFGDGFSVFLVLGAGIERVAAQLRAPPLIDGRAGFRIGHIRRDRGHKMFEILAAADTQDTARVVVGIDVDMASANNYALNFAADKIRERGDRKMLKQLNELKQLHSEISDLKKATMFTMLKEESSSDRIQAVSYVADLDTPDENVIEVLVKTLNHDKNVNVRMAAAYALSKFAGQRAVCDSLVRSLEIQIDPIIQVTLINILMERKEKSALIPIQKIIANKSTLKEVRAVAENSLRVLI